MDYNPITAELTEVCSEIDRLHARGTTHAGHVRWFNEFDSEAVASEIASHRRELDAQHAEIEHLDTELRRAEAELVEMNERTPDLRSEARVGVNVFRRFSNEHVAARQAWKSHQTELDRVRGAISSLHEQRDTMSAAANQTTTELSRQEAMLVLHQNFPIAETTDELADIRREINQLGERRTRLAARSDDVERAVERPLEEYRRDEAEVVTLRDAIAQLHTQIIGTEQQLKRAADFKGALDRAPDARSRALIHEDCDRKFGDGAPGRVMHRLRIAKQEQLEAVRGHEKSIERIGRDMKKTEQRIAKVAAAAAREIDTLVIDGSNCCFRGTEFIRLRALRPLTDRLAERYSVIVVFDASIRRRLRAGDEAIRRMLPRADVHVVASGGKADRPVLDIAVGPTTWVISNDRFGEFREKEAVLKRRLIRHDIVAGRILVEDLGIDVPLADGDRIEHDPVPADDAARWPAPESAPWDSNPEPMD